MAAKSVRVLVGTRKGTYIASSDAKRRKWTVAPVAHPGSDIFHVVADPRRPGTLYAAVNSGFWGPMVHRSENWGKTWKEVATPLTARRKDRKPTFDDSNPSAPTPKPVMAIWRLEPGHASEPDTLFAGVDPHMLFRSDDRAESWEPIRAINEHPDRKKWAPGFGGPCLHTVIVDPRDARRMYIGMSSVGSFRSDDRGEHWQPTNKGVECPFFPEGQRYPETGQCVHHIVLDAANPDLAYRQDHGGIYVNRTGMEGNWVRVGKKKGGPKDDFGFAVATAPHTPGRAFFVPLQGMARTTPNGGLQVLEWSEARGSWKALMPPTRFPGDYGVQREGLACDGLDPAGIYVGTTTGQLAYSPDAGRTWGLVPFQFPAIHSVSVAGP